MSDRVRRTAWLIAFLLFCSLGALSATCDVWRHGDALSPVDPYSEANTVRGARNFLDTGLTVNAGLANLLRPGLYDDEGFAGDDLAHRTRSLQPNGVYTHYPPGPEYLLYAAMRVFGATPLTPLRSVPLLISWAATLFFGLTLRRRFGAAAGWLLMAGCLALPLFSDAGGYLHAIGYAFALLLVEIALCLRERVLTPALFAVGFAQGWISFDYAFLVALAPGALEFALPRLRLGDTAQPRRALWRCAAAGAGFTAAHALHFVEVGGYFGSFSAALHDLGAAASYRAGAELGGLGTHLLKMDGAIFSYFVSMFPVSTFFWAPDATLADNWRMCRFLGLTLGAWWIVLTLGMLLRNAWQARRGVVGDARLLGDWLFVSLCGFVPSSLWLLVMVDHAIEHRQFLYRHLFFAFFLWLLFVVTAVLRRAQQPAMRASATQPEIAAPIRQHA